MFVNDEILDEIFLNEKTEKEIENTSEVLPDEIKKTELGKVTISNDDERLAVTIAEVPTMSPIQCSPDVSEGKYVEERKNLGEFLFKQPPGLDSFDRIICATEPFIDESFQSTEHYLDKIVTEFNQEFKTSILSTLLPIKIEDIQGDQRKYVVALSTDSLKIPWSVLEKISENIFNRCNNISRVVFAFGGAIKQPIREITKTVANEGTLYSLHQADNIVENILMRALDPAGHPLTLMPCMNCLHHIRVLMFPIHFDLQFTPPQYFPSICHSYCLKPVIASDFTTGKAAIPGKDIDESVIMKMVECIKRDVHLTSRILIDLTSKVPTAFKTTSQDNEINEVV